MNAPETINDLKVKADKDIERATRALNNLATTIRELNEAIDILEQTIKTLNNE